MCVSSHWAGDDYHSQIIRNHKDKWPSQWDQSTAILQAGCPKGRTLRTLPADRGILWNPFRHHVPSCEDLGCSHSCLRDHELPDWASDASFTRQFVVRHVHTESMNSWRSIGLRGRRNRPVRQRYRHPDQAEAQFQALEVVAPRPPKNWSWHRDVVRKMQTS